MRSEFSQQRIEEIKDSLSNIIDSLKEDLTEEYLNNHCSKVSENLHDYDDCFINRKVFTEQSYSEATQEAKKAIEIVLKDLGFSINN